MKNLFMATCMLLISATWSQAYSLYVGSPYSSPIYSVVNGVKVTEGGGSMSNSTLNGVSLNYLYCVDLFTNVYANKTYAYTTVNNSGLIHGYQLNNVEQVAWLLSNYGTGGQGDQAVALQAAIWEVINGYDVYHLDTELSSAGVVTLYNKMLGNLGTGKVTDFLWINPRDDIDGSKKYQGLVTSAPVPEPGTMILLGIGMLGLAIYGKRRMNKDT